VKLKLFIIIFCISGLVLIDQARSGFNAPEILKRWQPLTADDFKGFPPPFSGWGGAISSNVYLEFDSLANRYTAYSAQNSRYSWLKDHLRDNEYVLNHEQYHFNISEYIARKLDAELAFENVKESTDAYEMLGEARFSLDSLQDRYDGESDHGLLKDLQRLWEYRTDSLLASMDPGKGYLIDTVFQRRFHWPSDYSTRTIADPDASMAYYIVTGEDYGLEFHYQVFQSSRTPTQMRQIYHTMVGNILADTFEIHDTYSINEGIVMSTFLDYSNTATNERSLLWIRTEHQQTAMLEVTYPDDIDVNSGYYKMARSIIGSFTKIPDPAEAASLSLRTTYNDGFSSGEYPNCILYTVTGIHGLSSLSSNQYDEDLTLRFKPVAKEASASEALLVITDEDVLEYEYSNGRQAELIIPRELFPNRSSSILVGYRLKRLDEVQCDTIYTQKLYAPEELFMEVN
jgi:hypothetical protein